ncbi:hypothetical protein FA10DRAFT_265719 [Acaromyces ingoldii]|uniref:UTP23 sensor motif region domain-containing protein n=1 Tax=Acaromyces ingoldii TaxID=215250 RepID=A0A316YRM4_9BASI|nr:hypothetical protein FA10DRAFT_265719 [Acaromyces ingoldii]PWN91891.1 hypothetical protein FA10DRAFT_265719 [Acaromyces ingoldii]
MPGERCLLDVLGPTNKHRYVLASDSAGLRAAVRRDVLAVPVCHHNERNVLVLEPMSDKTRLRCEELERAKLDLSAGRTVLGKRSGDIVGLDDDDGEHHRDVDADEDAAGTVHDKAKVALPRKKRPKGPNPLSVKKSTSLKKKKGKGGEKPAKEQGGDKKKDGASVPASQGGAQGAGGEGGVGGGKRKRRKRGHGSAATDQPPSS